MKPPILGLSLFIALSMVACSLVQKSDTNKPASVATAVAAALATAGAAPAAVGTAAAIPASVATAAASMAQTAVPAATSATSATAPADSTPTSAAGRWDKSTIFNYSSAAANAAWQQACGTSPSSLSEKDRCVTVALQQAKASASAVAFFRTTNNFLVTFDERGKVDYGQAGAPWANMGRPTPILFLNGSPDIITATIPDDYKKNPSYSKVLTPPPGDLVATFAATPWPEYGQLTSATSNANGQRFVVSYPMRTCRACADVGFLPIVYNFDTQGKLRAVETLAFKAK